MINGRGPVCQSRDNDRGRAEFKTLPTPRRQVAKRRRTWYEAHRSRHSRHLREVKFKMLKYERGNGSEGIVLSAYVNAGFIVSIPFGTGASYDLVVDAGQRLFKIQIKTAWLNNGCVLYKSQRRQPHMGLTRRPYRSGEVDYFAA